MGPEVREWIGHLSVSTDEGYEDLGESWVVGSAEEIAEGVKDCLRAKPVQRVVFEVTRNLHGVEHEEE